MHSRSHAHTSHSPVSPPGDANTLNDVHHHLESEDEEEKEEIEGAVGPVRKTRLHSFSSAALDILKIQTEIHYIYIYIHSTLKTMEAKTRPFW